MYDYENRKHMPRIRLPEVKPVRPDELARRRSVIDEILRLRREIGPIGVPTDRLIREVREESEQSG